MNLKKLRLLAIGVCGIIIKFLYIVEDHIKYERHKLHLIQSAREVSNHFWDNANFCLFIIYNLKDVDHRTTNKRR